MASAGRCGTASASRFRRSPSISAICNSTSRSRVMSRRISASALAGMPETSGVRNVPTLRLAQRRVEAANTKPRQRRLHPIDQPGALSDEVFTFRVGRLASSSSTQGTIAMLPVPGLPAQPAQEDTHQQRRVEPVGFGAAALTGHRNAAGVDHMRLDAARPQPTRQPEAVAACLGQNYAGDPAPRLGRLLPPALYERQRAPASSGGSFFSGRRSTENSSLRSTRRMNSSQPQ